MDPVVARFGEFVEAVSSTNSTKEKTALVSNFQDLKEHLYMLYAPLVTFGVTRAALMKFENKSKEPKKPPAKRRRKGKDANIAEAKGADGANGADGADTQYDLLGLMKALASRELSGHAAYRACLEFRDRHPVETHDLIMQLMARDLKTRLGKRLLNSAFGEDFIHEFKVSLGYDFHKCEKHFDKTVAAGNRWLMSRKYDGVRTVVQVSRDGYRVFSRDGHDLPALQYLGMTLCELFHTKRSNARADDTVYVVDGEVCSIDANNRESFKDAVSQVKRKSVLMTDLGYLVFDCLTKEEFDRGTSETTLSERYARFNQVFGEINHFNVATITDGQNKDTEKTKISVRTVVQEPWSSEAHLAMEDRAAENGWEGIILRRDGPYEGKRSKDILKIKKFHTAEYSVTGIETGQMRMINSDTGLEENVTTMTAVTIEHKGETVTVGSGWSHSQRNEFYTNPDAIIGKVIEVQYFEETTDKTGKISLRFPTVRHVWGDRRDM